MTIFFVYFYGGVIQYSFSLLQLKMLYKLATICLNFVKGIHRVSHWSILRSSMCARPQSLLQGGHQYRQLACAASGHQPSNYLPQLFSLQYLP